MRLTAVFATICASVFVSSLFAAQSYPTKPVRIIVPFSSGGPTDIVARIVGQKLSESFNKPVVIENRLGAAGVVGADMVAKSSPDGYTLLLCSSGPMVVSPGLQDKMPYDSVRDFAPVILVVSIPYVLMVNPSFPAQSVKELIALAQAKPGQLNYGSAGSGSAGHLASELFKSMAKINMVHIPYKGSAPAAIDLMAGQLQLLLDPAPSGLPHVRGGKLRGLGISTTRRFSLLPDLPTIAEAGLPGYEASVWSGICAPARTPRDIVAKLNREIAKGVSSNDAKERFLSLSADISLNTPEQFAAFISTELRKWSRMIRETGAKAN
jgi:tripartite-type tricarboxylate transporter receptor subunit TctC